MITKIVHYEMLIKSLRGGGGGWKPFVDFYYDDGLILRCNLDYPSKMDVKHPLGNEVINKKEIEVNQIPEIRQFWEKTLELENEAQKLWVKLKDL